MEKNPYPASNQQKRLLQNTDNLLQFTLLKCTYHTKQCSSQGKDGAPHPASAGTIKVEEKQYKTKNNAITLQYGQAGTVNSSPYTHSALSSGLPEALPESSSPLSQVFITLPWKTFSRIYTKQIYIIN